MRQLVRLAANTVTDEIPHDTEASLVCGGLDRSTYVAEAAALLRVLANPARLGIALHLLEGERSVGVTAAVRPQE